MRKLIHLSALKKVGAREAIVAERQQKTTCGPVKSIAHYERTTSKGTPQSSVWALTNPAANM